MYPTLSDAVHFLLTDGNFSRHCKLGIFSVRTMILLGGTSRDQNDINPTVQYQRVVRSARTHLSLPSRVAGGPFYDPAGILVTHKFTCITSLHLHIIPQ
jgi:hypothetical protein